MLNPAHGTLLNKKFFVVIACIFSVSTKKLLKTHQRKNFRFASNQVSQALTSVNKLPPGKFYLPFTSDFATLI